MTCSAEREAVLFFGISNSVPTVGHALPEDGGQKHVAQEHLSNFVNMFNE